MNPEEQHSCGVNVPLCLVGQTCCNVSLDMSKPAVEFCYDTLLLLEGKDGFEVARNI